MKHFFTILFLGICFIGHTQFLLHFNDSVRINNPIDNFVNFNKENIYKDSTVAYKFPFNSFAITDARYDTSYVGVRVNNVTKGLTNFHKVQAEGGLSAAIEKYLNNTNRFAFEPSGYKMICFIKQFRFSQMDSFIKATRTNARFSRLDIEVEAFMNVDNNFYPAVKIDTLITALSTGNMDLAILTDAANSFAKKASSISVAKVLSRSSYSLESIKKRFEHRFEKPILTDEKLRSGVYLNWLEFVNNQPSINEYKFEKYKGITFLYIKKAGEDWMPLREFFGYCNGAKIWINLRRVVHQPYFPYWQVI